MTGSSMNVSTVNNLICACLFWLLILFAIFYSSDRIYDNPAPVKAAYNIDGEATVPQTPQAQTHEASLATRLQQGNLENGRKVFGQCALCHTPVKDGPNRVGPHLWGVVGRPFAALDDFTYSRAMRAQPDKRWDFATLDAYLTSPRKAVPGTAMSFVGIQNPQDRADLLLYLRSLSDMPVALPRENPD